jgi:hypothetical protein
MIVTLIAALFCILCGSAQGAVQQNCPHPAFERRYNCRDCTNVGTTEARLDLERAADRSRELYRTISRYTDNGQTCGAILKKYVCTRSDWYCTAGSIHQAMHDTRTGHYFPPGVRPTNFIAPPKLRSQCPHPDFVRKHVCQNCRSAMDAAIFTTERRGRDRDLRMNNVFFHTVHSGGYALGADATKCVFRQQAPTYICQRRTKWYCRDAGDIHAEHQKRNGDLTLMSRPRTNRLFF